jgi:hypothetical protein
VRAVNTLERSQKGRAPSLDRSNVRVAAFYPDELDDERDFEALETGHAYAEGEGEGIEEEEGVSGYEKDPGPSLDGLFSVRSVDKFLKQPRSHQKRTIGR